MAENVFPGFENSVLAELFGRILAGAVETWAFFSWLQACGQRYWCNSRALPVASNCLFGDEGAMACLRYMLEVFPSLMQGKLLGCARGKPFRPGHSGQCKRVWMCMC